MYLPRYIFHQVEIIQGKTLVVARSGCWENDNDYVLQAPFAFFGGKKMGPFKPSLKITRLQ